MVLAAKDPQKQVSWEEEKNQVKQRMGEGVVLNMAGGPAEPGLALLGLAGGIGLPALAGRTWP